MIEFYIKEKQNGYFMCVERGKWFREVPGRGLGVDNRYGEIRYLRPERVGKEALYRWRGISRTIQNPGMGEASERVWR